MDKSVSRRFSNLFSSTGDVDIPEHVARRLARKVIQQESKKERETAEQKAIRLKKAKESRRKRLANETPEETKRRREKENKKKAAYRRAKKMENFELSADVHQVKRKADCSRSDMDMDSVDSDCNVLPPTYSMREAYRLTQQAEHFQQNPRTVHVPCSRVSSGIEMPRCGSTPLYQPHKNGSSQIFEATSIDQHTSPQLALAERTLRQCRNGTVTVDYEVNQCHQFVTMIACLWYYFFLIFNEQLENRKIPFINGYHDDGHENRFKFYCN